MDYPDITLRYMNMKKASKEPGLLFKPWECSKNAKLSPDQKKSPLFCRVLRITGAHDVVVNKSASTEFLGFTPEHWPIDLKVVVQTSRVAEACGKANVFVDHLPEIRHQFYYHLQDTATWHRGLSQLCPGGLIPSCR